MMKRAHKEELLAMLGAFLARDTDKRAFERDFVKAYVDDTPSDALSTYDELFFDGVLELLSFAAELPTAEERECGVFDVGELVARLSQWRAAYYAGTLHARSTML